MPYIGNTTSDFSIDTGNITNRAVTATKLSPSSVGSNGQVLSIDGSGNLQWSADSSGTALTGSTNNTICTVTGANAIKGNSDLLWNGSRLDIDTGGTEDALRIGNTAGTDTFIRLGSIGTNPDTHAVIKYDKDDNYLSLVVSGEAHGAGGILIANGGYVGINTPSPSSNLHVRGSGNDTILLVESTDADASVGPIIELFRNSSSPADNDALGRIDFKGEDDAGNASTFARIAVTALDVTNGTEDGRIDFITATNDTFNSTMSVVNNRIAIGHTDPSSNLHIKTSTSECLRLQSSSATSNFIRFTDNNNTSTAYIGHDTQFKIANQTNTDMFFHTNNLTRMVIKADGNVGIGTTSATSLLTVGSRAQIRSTLPTVLISPSSGDSSIQLRGNSPTIEFDATGGGSARLLTDGAAFTISNGTLDGVGTQSFHIAANNNVIIGNSTTSTTFLDIRRSENTVYSATDNKPNGLKIFNDCTVDGGFAGIELAATDAQDYYGSTLLKSIATGANYSNDFVIQTRSSGNYGERLRVLHGGGLTFNGDTAAANALDDYEEGTWTPVLTSGTGTNTVTYAAQNGYYCRVGQLVHVDFYVSFSNGSFGGSGTRLNGLPFSALNWGAGSVFLNSWNVNDDAVNIVCHTSGNSTLYFYVTRDNATWVELTISTAASAMIGACTYRTGA